MSLKQRIEEILRKFERYLEWKHRVVPCITTSDKVELPGIDYLDIDQATTDILKVVELDKEKIKKISPIKLAVIFHEVYERLAPKFGYETRKETKVFKAFTPNGKLMIEVCREMQDYILTKTQKNMEG